MHDQFCPMVEPSDDCRYIKATGHHLRERGCAYCERKCECDLIQRVRVDEVVKMTARLDGIATARGGEQV